MTEEESLRRTHEFYAALSKETQDKLIRVARESARAVSERSGQDVTEEAVAGVVVAMVRYITDNAVALAREALTDEEIRRLMDEEYRRMETGEEVEEEALVKAVAKRAREEHAYLFAHERPGPQP
jgi:hypothetical protein